MTSERNEDRTTMQVWRSDYKWDQRRTNDKRRPEDNELDPVTTNAGPLLWHDDDDT